MVAIRGILTDTPLSAINIPHMKNTHKNNPYEKKVLIIKSHVKDWINERGFWVTDDCFRAINDAVIDVLEKATVRTKLNGMKTVSRRHI